MLLHNLKSFTNQLLKSTDRFFFEPRSLNPLGFFRICIALFCILQLILVYPDLLNIFGEAGYLRRELAEAVILDYQPRLTWATDFLTLHFGIEESKGIYLFTYFFIFCLISLMVGFLTRLMSILCFLIFSMFFGTGSFVVFGADCFALLSLFYCIILPTGRAYSVDNYLFKRKPKPSLSSTFFIRILQFHLCLVYVMAGLTKAVGVAWWTGEGVWRSAMIHYFNEMDISWLANVPQVAAFLSVSVLILECLYPIFMSIKKTRPFWLIAIIGMHVGIAVVMGLHLFSFVMIFWNITAFGWDYVEALQVKVKNLFQQLVARIRSKKQDQTLHKPAL